MSDGKPLGILIADDELVARKRMHRLVSAMPGVEILAECKNGEEVLARAEELQPDVLLLDIRMPGLSGLETKALLCDDAPYVIFTTAHPEHAVEAFDVGAVDYVLKPIEAARLALAIERARGHIASRSTLGEAARGDLNRLALPTRKGVRLLDPASITHAVYDGTLVTLFVEGEPLLADMSLSELADRLPPGVFTRVHRRALLNLQRVARLEPQPTGGYLAVTDRGEKVDISRQAARHLRKRLGLS